MYYVRVKRNSGYKYVFGINNHNGSFVIDKVKNKWVTLVVASKNDVEGVKTKRIKTNTPIQGKNEAIKYLNSL